MDPVVENSHIDDTTTLFTGSRIKNSTVLDESEVGDFSRVYDSKLLGRNRVGRNSLVYHSSIDTMSYIGNNTVIMHSELGKYSSVSWNVTIGPANHDYSKLTTHDFLYNNRYGMRPSEGKDIYDRFSRKTIIGNDVWIGTGVVVMNGAEVSDGAVIGANATVTKDIPPYAIAVGSPARVVGYRFDETIIKKLLFMKWWDYSYDKIVDIYDLLEEGISIDVLDKINERLNK